MKMSFSVLALLATAVSAETITAWKDGPTYDLSYSAIRGLKMVVTVPENMWFSIGFGEGMINTDMVLFTGSGMSGDIKDLWSTKESTPQTDTNNAYAIGSLKAKLGDTYNFTAYRALNTRDAS